MHRIINIVICGGMASLLHYHPVLGWSPAKPKVGAPSSPSSPSPPATSTTVPENQQPSSTKRRAIFSMPLLVLSSTTFAIGGVHPTIATTTTANAFDNAIPDYATYADKPKRRGTPPKNLGILPRETEGEDDLVKTSRLRTCDGNPNCFSTTGDFLLSDRTQYGVDFFIPTWKPPPTTATDDGKEAFQTLKDVVKSYKAGQGGIDGGGFAVMKETDNYLYVQFESLKKGYIDDVEFALTKDTEGIQVRSGSRVGYTDFGVNAIRLNYLASQLREKGWSIDEITEKSHRDYWTASDEAREATFDASRRELK
eukprot:CAMPEP_0196133138 /NCGR_PEP_ID=MMETSP0910-20130528/2484_1 /TAXON_ID=49265 /ORGANISM="Thalassiosira rotula, Strain GSO102" /LENGTH=309 /DNA_ID=CAMNT_0041392831 /DNA_START=52 /DNA_END=981 /DNA_ORIENTATION=-